MVASILSQLSELIATSVAELERTCMANGQQVPDLDDIFTPESEAFRTDPIAAKAANNIAAAAFQLAACVLPPQESVMQAAAGHLKSAALRTALECHVPEILREAGDQGLHANDIAAKTGVDPQKLARVLRSLTNRHIFREIKPDVFVNNRPSSSLDTGKSVESILRDPIAKHDDTPGQAAIVELAASDMLKASGCLTETMKDPATAQSQEPHDSPLNRALGVQKPLFQFLAEPEQEYRRRRFGIAMKGFATTDVSDLILKLFDWTSLPKDALVVDVGGGIGTASSIIAKAHPNLKFVVQDAPSVTEDGVKFWNQVNPEAIRSGRVKLQGHDFFTPQPITNASVFLLKNVLHDWSNAYSVKILSQLRRAATPDTHLLILDTVLIPVAQKETGVKLEALSGATVLDPPSILSVGYGSVIDMVWTLDLAMMVFHNAQEHTVTQFDDLFKSTGWKIAKIVRSGGTIDSVLAKPI